MDKIEDVLYVIFEESGLSKQEFHEGMKALVDRIGDW